MGRPFKVSCFEQIQNQWYYVLAGTSKIRSNALIEAWKHNSRPCW